MENPNAKKPSRTKVKLQDALVRLSSRKSFANMSVAELCREANLGRTTFYLHYQNTREVYDDVVRRLITAVKTQREGMGCAKPEEDGRPTLCEFIRGNREWAGIVNDPHFAQTLIQLSSEDQRYDHVERLVERGLSRQQAIAVYTFQINGCCALATSPDMQDGSFRQCRRTIDAFLRAGLDAVCSRPNRI